MSKEFKNIDDLFRSELGGNTQKAPEFVKDNIDAALGFNKRRYGWLFTGLFVGIIVLTIGIVWLMNDSSFKQLAHTKLDSIGQEKDQRLLQTYDTKFDLESNLSTDLLDDGDLSSPSSMTDQLDQTDLNNNTTVNHQTNTRINGAIIPDIQVDKTKNKKAIDQGDGIVITTTQAEIVLEERDQGNSNEELMIEGLDTGNQETDLELAPTDEETEQKTEDKPINTKLSNGDTDNSMSDPSNVQKSTSEDQVNVVKQNQSDTDTTEIEASLEVPLAHNTVTDPSTPDSTINNAPIESKPDAYKPWMLSLSSGITKARTKYTPTDMIEETYYNNAITDGFKMAIQCRLDLSFAQRADIWNWIWLYAIER